MINAYKILKIFCLISLIVFPSMLIGYPLIGAMGHTKFANRSVIAGSIVHMAGLLVLFLTGKMNIYSIAFMVLVTECVVFGIRLYAIWKFKLLNLTKEQI